MNNSDKPIFWRDSRLPYLELRQVIDGRKVCYAPHSHPQWSLGAITEGSSLSSYQGNTFQVSAGSLLMMNPYRVHACNPLMNQPWSYLMLYIDTQWLASLRYESGLLETPCWQDIPTTLLTDPEYYAGYCQMAECLLDPDKNWLDKQTVVIEYLTTLMFKLVGQIWELKPPPNAPDTLLALATYLQDHATQTVAEVSLDALCERSGYSPSHLIRTFRYYFGLTPHAYWINARIQLAQQELKQGKPIAETALNAGFADQPHFQRTFKRLLAVTPRQYQQASSNQ
ncbi:AraC family transcriptional regulator [Thiofilum flexile]|uniref:AraC family transcriptional regulator n=1 Tax=Thiofilum flexile TaxID=125627 RepID=UPI0003613733|nr:AraC family transcriptional regulator [Thiofilum flexile]